MDVCRAWPDGFGSWPLRGYWQVVYGPITHNKQRGAVMTVTGTTEITNTADIIDSREIIERIETLESWRDDPTIGLDEDEARELSALRDLTEEGEGLSDWQHGVTLIRDDYFEEYAQEYFEDTRDSNSSKITEWPYCHIDWEAAADALKQDYTSIKFGDETYWGR